jgi:hypothetical protein
MVVLIPEARRFAARVDCGGAVYPKPLADASTI